MVADFSIIYNPYGEFPAVVWSFSGGTILGGGGTNAFLLKNSTYIKIEVTPNIGLSPNYLASYPYGHIQGISDDGSTLFFMDVDSLAVSYIWRDGVMQIIDQASLKASLPPPIFHIAGANYSGTIFYGYRYDYAFSAAAYIYNGGALILVKPPSALDFTTTISGVNYNGSVIWGYYTGADTTSGDPRHPTSTYYYIIDNGIYTTIQYPGDASRPVLGTFITGMTTDGSTAYGIYYDTRSVVHGFTYNNGLYKSIDLASNHHLSGFKSISNDGNVLLADCHDGYGVHGFLVKDNLFYIGINVPNGLDGFTTVESMSALGSVVVGNYATTDPVSGGPTSHGFVFKDGIYTTIDYPSSPWTVLKGISPDGKTIYGESALGPFLVSNFENPTNTTLSIAATSADKLEGNRGGVRSFTFTVTRSGDTSMSHSVDWAANWVVSGSTVDRIDFEDGFREFPQGTVNFAAGETTKLIVVNILGDSFRESDETFEVFLSNPSVGARLANEVAAGTIRNDDIAKSIIWQNSQNGDVVGWSIQENAFESLGYVGSTGSKLPWLVEAQGNFDDNPGTDIVWKNISNGAVYIWDTANNTFAGGGAVGGVDPLSGWEIVSCGDFNNDQYSDLLWQNSITNDVYVWNIQNNAFSGGVFIGTAGANSGWEIKALGEFDGKGNSDILWQNKCSGDVYIWDITNNQFSGGGFVGSVGSNSGWEIKDTGYFDSDNYSDILWQNSITGDVYIWDIVNNAVSGASFVGSVGTSSAWEIQNAGMYNSDDFSDILWHNSGSGEAYIWNIANNTAFSGASLGAPPTPWTIAPVNSPIL